MCVVASIWSRLTCKVAGVSQRMHWTQIRFIIMVKVVRKVVSFSLW